MDDEFSELIKDIEIIKSTNSLPNYIDFIQFPFFRNIELDQRINFDFPLTVFIGTNGSGKSSTLHALYGCPEGKTPYDFWFSTDVDPVEYELKSRSLRHSFFYGFNDPNGNNVQVVKARIRRRGNPNYWETSRPLLSYGMEKPPDGKDRNEPIKKNVIYLDFRAELSAFDKYFYFEIPPKNLISKTKQEYLSRKSITLKKIFDGTYKTIKSSSGALQNEEIYSVNHEELNKISQILGKNYTEINIIRHKLFRSWGYSVFIKTNHHHYSEAFAGSGEMAVIRLVISIFGAEANSLILLDEPEVSLHPGAQYRLKSFLLEQIKLKKHQIVISSHSPTFASNLPASAIKVFTQKEDTGKFIIKENILPEEAFFFIGEKINDKITIVVEDKLALKVIDRLLDNLGPEVKSRFVVSLIPGGAETINKYYIPVFSNTKNDKYFFIFDGDKNYVENFFDVSTLNDRDRNERFLKSKIKEQTGCEIQFYVDGNAEGGNTQQRILMMIDFLKHYSKHVSYLPMENPEEIIWSEEVLQQVLKSTDYDNNIERIRSFDSAKKRIFESAIILFGAENQMEALEDILIKEWIVKEDENYNVIKNIIATRLG